MADDFAAFRAVHGDVTAAIAACERPDWLFRLAWEACPDKKAVISLARSCAAILTRRELDDLLPRVPPLEVVEGWLGEGDPADAVLLRAGIAGSVIGPALGSLASLFTTPLLPAGRSEEVLVFLCLGFMALVTAVARGALLAARRRKVAALDEARAWAIVTSQLERGTRRRAKPLPAVMKLFVKRVLALVPARFSWPRFDAPQPLDGARAWTAEFDSYDQHHERCFYRVQLLDGGARTGEVMAEVGMEFAGDDWTRPEFLTTLRARLASVAATGQSNSSWQP